MSLLRIGTRGSDLALTQAREVAGRLREAGFECELVTITTTGDRREIPRAPGGVGKALWTREIEEALLGGDIDLAVHSLKDLPADLPVGLVVGAVRPREDARDVLVSAGAPRSPEDLPRGARVGTGSARRAAALLGVRPDLDVVELKGNVPTRLRRLQDGDFDAIVLAAAGLNRLGLRPEGAFALPEGTFAPALCQGIVAIEIREADRNATWVGALDHAPTSRAMAAERALLRRLDVGCGAPVGGLATVRGDVLELFGEVLSLDGSTRVREHVSGPTADAEALGAKLGHTLAEGPAAELLAELRGDEPSRAR